MRKVSHEIDVAHIKNCLFFCRNKQNDNISYVNVDTVQCIDFMKKDHNNKHVVSRMCRKVT